jgi:hypothetical protein
MSNIKEDIATFQLDENHFYRVHIKHDLFYNSIEYEVYPMIQYWDRGDREEGFKLGYTELDEHVPSDHFDKEKVELHFEGMIRYVGVWDSRIYFPDDSEYDVNDIIKWASLLCYHVQPLLRYRIKEAKPDQHYDD